ncbi:hypothetical protein BV22DRAFT_1025951, partial [Leucogyrophana mollusca]
IGSRQRRGCHTNSRVLAGPWSPWNSRLSCTLDVISHLPRANFSDKDLEVMLWLLQMNGVNEIPSVGQVKALSDFLDTTSGVQTKRYMGAFGHAYHVVRLQSLIAMDLANPLVREHLDFYPEDAGTSLKEARQASQWLHHTNPHRLSPMCRVGSLDYYTFEPARLGDGTICMPFRFFMKAGVMWFHAWKMTVTVVRGNTGWVVDQSNEITSSVDHFSLSGKELVGGAYLGPGFPSFNVIHGYQNTSGGVLNQWPHPVINPWRTKANGARVVSYPVWLYCDDTSGNRSKKWNEHNIHRESNIHFLCTSNTAPPLEMLDGVIQEFEECQNDGVWAYDCVFNEKILVLPFILALLGDNPMQSEFACHAGLRANFFCRCCWVSSEADSTLGGLGSMIDRIKRFMKVQTFSIYICTSLLTLHRLLRTSTGVKDNFLAFFLDKVQKVRKGRSGADAEGATHRIFSQMPSNPFNPLWRVKGFIKYFWRDAIERLSDDQKATLKTRLSCIDVSGLDPNVSALKGHTLVQYSGSLPEIDDIDDYLFHLLLHIIDHIRRFGPAIIFATEGFESYNAVIRGWCINSNRQAPSRDAAKSAASLARLRHLVTGGYYKAEVEDSDGSVATRWITAGSMAIEICRQSPVVYHKLGLVVDKEIIIGLAKLSKKPHCHWENTLASQYFSSPCVGAVYHTCLDVTATNGDVVGIGEFIIYFDGQTLHITQIIEILVRQERIENQKAELVLLVKYDIGPVAAPYRMPKIKKTGTHFLTEPKVCMQFHKIDLYV